MPTEHPAAKMEGDPGFRSFAERCEPPEPSAATELDGLRKLYGQKFNAITAALGHATEAQDKLALGYVDAAMEEIGKVVSILVDA